MAATPTQQQRRGQINRQPKHAKMHPQQLGSGSSSSPSVVVAAAAAAAAAAAVAGFAEVSCGGGGGVVVSAILCKRAIGYSSY